MDLTEAINNRRTIHLYSRNPLPEGAVDRALEAAIMAPNHKLTFPWHFTRVGRETREQIAQIAIGLKQRPDHELTKEQRSKILAKILNPAELIVLSIDRNPDAAIAREDYASAACAIQNLTLSLFAEGVGTKWGSGKLTVHLETYAVLEIDPMQQEIIGFIWAGIATTTPKAPERPALKSMLRELP